MQAMRAKDLNEMFPVVDAEAPLTASPRGFANLLWKQLDHLGYVSHSDPQARFQLFLFFAVRFEIEAAISRATGWFVSAALDCAGTRGSIRRSSEWTRTGTCSTCTPIRRLPSPGTSTTGSPAQVRSCCDFASLFSLSSSFGQVIKLLVF
jgi:hypothetical protein